MLRTVLKSLLNFNDREIPVEFLRTLLKSCWMLRTLLKSMLNVKDPFETPLPGGGRSWQRAARCSWGCITPRGAPPCVSRTLTWWLHRRSSSAVRPMGSTSCSNMWVRRRGPLDNRYYPRGVARCLHICRCPCETVFVSSGEGGCKARESGFRYVNFSYVESNHGPQAAEARCDTPACWKVREREAAGFRETTSWTSQLLYARTTVRSERKLETTVSRSDIRLI
jgi:hypothetical protein